MAQKTKYQLRIGLRNKDVRILVVLTSLNIIEFMKAVVAIDLSLWCYQPPPRDILKAIVEEKLGHLELEIDESMERTINPMKFVRQELSELRCGDHNDPSRVGADAGMCVCTLLERMDNIADQDWIPKGLFVECLAIYGYSEQRSLEKYRIYAREKLEEEDSETFQALWEAEQNAINWSYEYRRGNPERSSEARQAKAEAREAIDGWFKQIKEETDRIMAQSY